MYKATQYIPKKHEDHMRERAPTSPYDLQPSMSVWSVKLQFGRKLLDVGKCHERKESKDIA